MSYTQGCAGSRDQQTARANARRGHLTQLAPGDSVSELLVEAVQMSCKEQRIRVPDFKDIFAPAFRQKYCTCGMNVLAIRSQMLKCQEVSEDFWTHFRSNLPEIEVSQNAHFATKQSSSQRYPPVEQPHGNSEPFRVRVRRDSSTAAFDISLTRSTDMIHDS